MYDSSHYDYTSTAFTLISLNMIAVVAKKQPGLSAAFNSVCFAELFILASAPSVIFATAYCAEVETMGELER